jgi:O-antigen ligase
VNRVISGKRSVGEDLGINGQVAAALFLSFAAAVVVGLGAGVVGWPLLAVLAVLAAATAVFYRPFLGVVLLAATLPLENLPIFDIGGFGLGRIIGLAVFGSWLVQKIAKRQSWRRVVSGGFFPAAIGFLVWILASMLWAEHRPVVRSGFIRMAQVIALALIVIDLVDSRRKLDLIAKALVLSALLAAGMTLYQAQVLGLRRAGEDISGGVNNTAMMLVTVIPLGFYLIRTSRHYLWGLVGTLYLVLGAVAVVTTYSRMNLLLLPPLFAVLYLLTFRDRRGRRWLVAIGIAGAVAATLLVPWDELAKRIDTIDTYLNETMQLGPVQTEQSSRGYHLLIGLKIARDHPLIGVGYGNYGHFFRDEYQFQVPGAPKLYGSVRSPHSSLVGIAADLGAIGLAAWLLLQAICATSAIRAWRRARAGRTQDLVPMIEALLLMLGLNVVAYGLYAPNQGDKLLWIVMSLCIAAGHVVTAEIKGSESVAVSSGPDRNLLSSAFPSDLSRQQAGSHAEDVAV